MGLRIKVAQERLRATFSGDSGGDKQDRVLYSTVLYIHMEMVSLQRCQQPKKKGGESGKFINALLLLAQRRLDGLLLVSLNK